MAYAYGGCEHYESGVTVTDLKALVERLERYEAALGAVRHRLLANAEVSESGLVKYIEAALNDK